MCGKILWITQLNGECYVLQTNNIENMDGINLCIVKFAKFYPFEQTSTFSISYELKSNN